MKKILLLMLLSAFTATLYGQSCNGFNKTKGCTRFNVEGYNVYGQSTNALLLADSTYRYSVVLFGGKEYRVSFCADREFYPIHFRLINAKTNEVTYDNETDKYVESVGFAVNDTRQIIIEVTLMPKKQDYQTFSDRTSCVGILIQWNKIPSIGFK
ncbi:MAG TPA: hypothetical protein VMW01_10410 [Williamwhitmania sp.]|nr:hypothetical protein [Williamwhitmania sp.]